jgi:subtilisin family serine protease
MPLPIRFLARLAGLLVVALPISAPAATYQVLLKGETVADANERTPGSAAAKSAAGKARQDQIGAQHADLEAKIAAEGKVRVIGTTETLVNSILVLAEPADLESLRRLPGVDRVERVQELERHTRTSVPFIGAPLVWQSATPGLTGRGIRIGIVDSGIDYTHAAFGGTGTPAAFAANNPTFIEPGTFPTSKVLGGRDFAGDGYDASGVDGTPSPSPDSDPLDPQANGHGSHVAAIAAGFGVLDTGATFAGPYGTHIYTNTFLVGPGVAPESKLYALKVFGRRGTTSLVPLALNAAADPNGDGDTSDRLDVVNLSLGSGFAVEGNDPQITAINRLASLGCVVVISAGNAGNTHYVLGSPGASARAITVANTFDDGSTSSTITVTAPVEVVGDYSAVEGAFTFRIAEAGTISAQVVQSLPLNACLDGDNGLISNGPALSGKIALIDRGTCFFVNKVRAAQEAGAVAVIMVNNVDGFPFPMGGTGDTSDIRIPGVMISRADGAVLRRRLADGLFVTFEPRAATVRPELADQLADSSSRGPVAFSSRLKPDIAAPGSSIPSARAGFGNESILQTGTSMSAPHVAGAAAILKQIRPTWSSAEIKAVLMNTAARTANGDGVPYPESKVGAGRVSLPAAATTTVIARNDAAPDEVSLSIGYLELSGPYSDERRIRITNKGTTPATLNISVSNSIGAAVAWLVPSTNVIKVSAGQERVVSFTFHANPANVEDDPTTPDNQGERLRPKMPEASGQIWFRSSTVAIHVPWHSIIRPVSLAQAGATQIGLPSGPVASIPVPTRRPATNTTGLVGVFQLGSTSGNRGLSGPAGAGDALAIGAASDFGQTRDLSTARIFLGLATAGRWVTPQSTFYSLDFEVDVDLDGNPDFRVVNTTGGNINANKLADDRVANDFLVSAVQSLDGGGVVEGSVLNVLDPRQLDTAVFQNAVLVHGVPASALGLSPANTRFRYRAVLAASGGSETTGWSEFDLAAPLVDATAWGIEGSPWQREGSGIRVSVTRSANPADILLLHLHNPVGSQVELVRVDPSTPDTDRNGLVDVQELLYFPTLGAVGSADPDGDGLTTSFELGSGTNPLNAASGFRAGPVTRGSGANPSVAPVFSCRTVPGRRYGVLRAPAPGGPYLSIATGLVATREELGFVDPAPPAAGAYYRFVAE